MVLEGVVEGVRGREGVLELVIVWLWVPVRLVVRVQEGVLELEGVLEGVWLGVPVLDEV
jgi:hypothetical protein